MYSSLDSVTKKINQTTLLQLLNDEARGNDEIDLTDSSDLVVVRFNDAATAAQSEIDPYLRAKYTLPFDSVPQRVIDLSDDLTIYNIYKRRGNIPEDQTIVYKAVQSSLKDISLGKSDLGVANEPQQISNEIRTNKTSKDKIFNNDLWKRF